MGGGCFIARSSVVWHLEHGRPLCRRCRAGRCNPPPPRAHLNALPVLLLTPMQSSARKGASEDTGGPEHSLYGAEDSTCACSRLSLAPLN